MDSSDLKFLNEKMREIRGSFGEHMVLQIPPRARPPRIHVGSDFVVLGWSRIDVGAKSGGETGRADGSGDGFAELCSPFR